MADALIQGDNQNCILEHDRVLFDWHNEVRNYLDEFLCQYGLALAKQEHDTLTLAIKKSRLDI